MITVVIPAYNAEKTIISCLDSVINQSRIELIDEIIVVNDGSIDNTKMVVESYMQRKQGIHITLVNKLNGGVSTARNTGIRLAKSEWIALLDSDDMWKPNKIELQISKIISNPKIKFIGGGRNQEELRIGKHIEGNLYSMGVKNLLIKYWPHPSTVLIHTTVFNECGMFDETRTHAEDGQLWLKIATRYPLYYISNSIEIAGDNKITYGVSGLSANLKAMHEGCVKNVLEAYHAKQINNIEKYFYILYENVKYVRRIILTKWRRL